jgi:hypothetical protein
VKNHDFTPKNHIFPILGGAREIFGVFHVKNHDFTPSSALTATTESEETSSVIFSERSKLSSLSALFEGSSTGLTNRF